MPTNQEAWRRRHAIQIAAQLPESTEDAIAVLGYVREIVDTFLAVREAPAAGVVSLSERSATARRSATAIVNPSRLPR